MAIIFFFNDTATTEIYTLSLHDALPIYRLHERDEVGAVREWHAAELGEGGRQRHVGDVDRHDVDRLGHEADRKSTRLNSNHANISYAVLCLNKSSIVPTLKKDSSASSSC